MSRRSNSSLPTNLEDEIIIFDPVEVQEIVLAEPQSPIGASADQIKAVIQIVLDAVESPQTQRAYGRALRDFAAWMNEQQRPLNRALLRRYVATLREQEMGNASINQRLSAIRTFVRELTDNNALDPALAQGILSVPGLPQRGVRLGNWLNPEQAALLINSPDISTNKGLRDRAILAILIGCGLRREELTTLTVAHIKEREGRWVIVDLVGKRNKIRSVPMPSWAKAALDVWLAVAGTPTYDDKRYLFRAVNKGGNIADKPLTPQAIHNIVKEYAEPLGFDELAPHDLRRTFAKLAHRGGAPVDQIGLSLGHDSIETTQRYLGLDQDLHNAPCDFLELPL
ncbi:MAG: tyrosine-type recombinase/integrase [Anaerolineales bacterium]|nr:tyrosine-type recombinase/integrase [Anaerolineales bacterium]MCB9128941.1 tyrosine-type recombinase/integrase [Ardenticatenales bacterium]MCB9172826.1 tyrosine-type recombinase/integrase [Ardenticatenales bacterium]